MFKIIKAALFLILFMQIPAYATGFGSLNIHSSLGEPLNLSLKVLGVDDYSDDNLRFSIADKELYTKMGVDYNFSHGQLKLQIERDKKQHVTLRIRSSKPMHEPFINFIFQLQSPTGVHIKEVTALLELPKKL